MNKTKRWYGYVQYGPEIQLICRATSMELALDGARKWLQTHRVSSDLDPRQVCVLATTRETHIDQSVWDKAKCKSVIGNGGPTRGDVRWKNMFVARPDVKNMTFDGV